MAPDSVGLEAAVNLLIIAVIGGLGRIEGAWLGAFTFIVIQNYVRDFNFPGLSFGGTLFGGSFNTIIGIIFLAIVLVSPDGLIGIWDRLYAVGSRGVRWRRAVEPQEAPGPG
jgi:branched-chain amino acid transport system permease protein